MLTLWEECRFLIYLFEFLVIASGKGCHYYNAHNKEINCSSPKYFVYFPTKKINAIKALQTAVSHLYQVKINIFLITASQNKTMMYKAHPQEKNFLCATYFIIHFTMFLLSEFSTESCKTRLQILPDFGR